MNRSLFSALSAITIATGTAVYYVWKQISVNGPILIDRLLIKKVLIRLRKRAYSTLRQISFIVNNIRTLEGDLEVKKISQIFMRDGGSGQQKLRAIEALVLKEEKIDQKDFEHSCSHYCQQDIQIKMLLQTFRKDLNMALEGVIEAYHGPIPRFEPEIVLKIQEQIIRRRMQIIEKKYLNDLENEDCLRMQACMQRFIQVVSQEYLAEQGISHEKQPNEKLFMSILEQYYRHDAQFKERFEQLELEMEMFIIDIENKCRESKKEIKLNKEEQQKEEEKIQKKNQEKQEKEKLELLQEKRQFNEKLQEQL